MFNLKNKIALVYDWSYFFSIAQTIAPEFKEVWYHCPRDSNYSTIERARIGYGYPNIKVVDEDDVHSNLDKFGLIIFPDVGDGGLAKKWSKDGLPVISSKMGEGLENDRLYFKKKAKEIGLNVGKFEKFNDIDDLEDYLKKNKDKIVKLPYWRGICESHPYKSWDTAAENWLIDVSQKLDIFRHNFEEFIVEDFIESPIENGTDRLFANGKFLEYGLVGTEQKNACYLAKVCSEKEIPKDLRDIDNKLSKLYTEFEVCSPVSTECRWPKKGEGYVIDMTMRAGFPPIHSMLKAFGNIGKIFYGMAHNKEVDMEVDYKYVCELIINSESAGENCLLVEYPKKFDDNIMLKSPAIVEGKRYVIPIDGAKVIGSVATGSDNLEDCIAECREIVKEIKCDGIYYDEKSFDRALEELKKSEKLDMGIDS